MRYGTANQIRSHWANAEMVPCFASGRKCNFTMRTLCWALLLAIIVGVGLVGGLKFVGNSIQWNLLFVYRLEMLSISQVRIWGVWIISNTLVGTFICLHMLIHLCILFLSSTNLAYIIFWPIRLIQFLTVLWRNKIYI